MDAFQRRIHDCAKVYVSQTRDYASEQLHYNSQLGATSLYNSSFGEESGLTPRATIVEIGDDDETFIEEEDDSYTSHPQAEVDKFLRDFRSDSEMSYSRGTPGQDGSGPSHDLGHGVKVPVDINPTHTIPVAAAGQLCDGPRAQRRSTWFSDWSYKEGSPASISHSR